MEQYQQSKEVFRNYADPEHLYLTPEPAKLGKEVLKATGIEFLEQCTARVQEMVDTTDGYLHISHRSENR